MGRLAVVDTASIIERLREANRMQVSRETGIPYGYLSKLVYDEIANPGSRNIDKLREYFSQRQPESRQ